MNKQALIWFANTPELVPPIKNMLEGQDYLVKVLDGTKKHTLEEKKVASYDLVITEIILAFTDGFTLLQSYKKNNRTGKFIFITGLGGDINTDKALELGADGYIYLAEMKSVIEVKDCLASIIKEKPYNKDYRKDSSSHQEFADLNHSNSSSTDLTWIFSLIGLIVVFCIGSLFLYMIGDWIIKSFKGDGRKSAFWHGTDTVQVCKKPYYSSDDCYELLTYMPEDESYAQINFPNGGYVISEDIECYDAANYGDTPKYVFCRSWDNEGNQWDFMPTWVNY